MTLSEKKQKILDIIKDNPGYTITLNCGSKHYPLLDIIKLGDTCMTINTEITIPYESVKQVIIEEQEDDDESSYCDATIDDTY